MSDEKDSIGSKPPVRNGNEKRQDQELSSLRDDVRLLRVESASNRVEVIDNRNANEMHHASMAVSAEANYHRTAEKIDSVITSVASNNIALSSLTGIFKGSSKTKKIVATVVFTILLALLPALGWVFGRTETRVDTLEAETTGNLEVHKSLRRDVDKNESDIENIRQLQRLPKRGPSLWPEEE